MPDNKHDAATPNQDKEGHSVLVEDQTSFVDEDPPGGKHFGDGRKVADLGRVGAMSPDSDSADSKLDADADSEPEPLK